MTSCQKKEEAFAHVMGTMLDFKSDSPMMKAMGELEYDYTKCIVTMNKEEVTRLVYTDTVNKGYQSIEVTKNVPMKSKETL
eukprot:13612837-Ditylum_brightwellii.AAC.1